MVRFIEDLGQGMNWLGKINTIQNGFLHFIIFIPPVPSSFSRVGRKLYNMSHQIEIIQMRCNDLRTGNSLCYVTIQIKLAHTYLEYHKNSSLGKEKNRTNFIFGDHKISEASLYNSTYIYSEIQWSSAVFAHRYVQDCSPHLINEVNELTEKP